jgi:hypothetical protein
MTALLEAGIVAKMRGRAQTNLMSLLSPSGKWWESCARGIVWTALVVVVGCLALNIGVAADTWQIVAAFDRDEGLSGTFLRRALTNESLDPRGFFNYGFSYIAAPYFVVRGLERLGYEASDYLVFYVGRAVSLASYAIVLAATYCTARRAGVSRTIATLSVGVLGSISSLSIYAQVFRPDLPQVASVALAFACLAMPTTASMLAATAFASLGFGLKYSGAFVLVPIAVSGTLAEFSGRAPWRGSMLRRIALVVSIPAVFVTVWLLTNPYVVSEWSAFRKDIAFERAHVARGHRKTEAGSPAEWLPVLEGDLSVPVRAIVAVGVLALAVGAAGPLVMRRKRPNLGRLRRALRSPRRRFMIATVAYATVAIAFLLLEVNMRRARYWMHILPAVVIIGAAGWVRLCRLLPARLKQPAFCLASVGVATLLGSTVSARSELGNRTREERALIGEWIAERYSPSARILADTYTYLPPHFTRVKTGEPSRSAIAHDKPELVILSRYGTGASCWMRPDTRFIQGDFACRARDGHDRVRRMMGWLASRSAYEVKKESNSFVVLQRKPDAADDEP